jgi:hypothetical protein
MQYIVDDDGVSNCVEYLADTDPTNAESALTMIGLGMTNTLMVT